MKTRRGDSALATIIALVILVVALYMVFPSWFTWLPIGQNSSLGQKIIVTYEDGTTKTFDPSDFWAFIRGSQVIDPSTSKVVTKVTVITMVVPTWVGTMQSTTLTGSVTALVGVALKQEDVIPNYTPFTSGVPASVKTVDYTAATISAWTPSEGSYILTIISSVTFKVNFTDATSDTRTAECTSTLNYKIANWKITGLIVSISPTTTLVP